MERLTERFENGQVGTLGCGNNCKYNYRYCDNALENCPTIAKIFEKLADYEDAEEQGLLLRLPCKVGDTVYKPNPITKKEIVGIEIESIFITESGINISGRTTIKKYSFCCKPDDFGKTVFLTEVEAEAKLKEMESSHE